MEVLVTGASGQLGHDVCHALSEREIGCRGVCAADMDVTDHAAVRNCIKDCRPDAVIHCAAYTAVDQAEDEPERCWTVNAEGTRNIALSCREFDAKIIYISTDYVFPGSGERSYRPDDPTGPLNVYGQSKLEGELAIQTLMERFFIVRTSWLFGSIGRNFVRTMLRMTQAEVNVVCDQVGSPTYSVDLAQLLCDMVITEKYGVYHASNEGVCSWAEFAEEIFRLSGNNTKVNPVPTAQYPTKAVRPLNSRLNKGKLEEAGFSRLPPWQEALKRYLWRCV